MTPRDHHTVTTGAAPTVEELADVELTYIQSALARNGGNISRTAQELRISRSTLYRKLKKG